MRDEELGGIRRDTGYTLGPDGKPEHYPFWEELERLEYFMAYSTRLEDEIAALRDAAKEARAENEADRAAMRRLRGELDAVCQRAKRLSDTVRNGDSPDA